MSSSRKRVRLVTPPLHLKPPSLPAHRAGRRLALRLRRLAGASRPLGSTCACTGIVAAWSLELMQGRSADFSRAFSPQCFQDIYSAKSPLRSRSASCFHAMGSFDIRVEGLPATRQNTPKWYVTSSCGLPLGCFER